MSEWQVELNGRKRDLKFLCDLLRNSPHPIVVEDVESERFFITLPGYPPDVAPAVLKDAATSLVEIVNGAAKLYYESFEGIGFTKVSRLDDDGKRLGHSFLTLEPRSFILTADQQMAGSSKLVGTFGLLALTVPEKQYDSLPELLSFSSSASTGCCGKPKPPWTCRGGSSPCRQRWASVHMTHDMSRSGS